MRPTSNSTLLQRIQCIDAQAVARIGRRNGGGALLRSGVPGSSAEVRAEVPDFDTHLHLHAIGAADR
jgi:hypothetical protein